jgi:hypothetical protein
MKQILSFLFKDRLVIILLAGLLIFVVDAYLNRETDLQITIDLPLLEKLAAQWMAQTKREPTAQELDMLIEGHVREEILMRESIRLGLDRDDTIIRRRLAQKMEFVLSDTDELEIPTEDQLRKFHADNLNIFSSPMRLSFRHIFLGDQDADAAQVLSKLEAVSADDNVTWRKSGRPFMLQNEYANRTREDLGQLFGMEFVDALAKLKVGSNWLGPIRSAYGIHLVQLVDKMEARALGFEESADRVAQYWLQLREREAKAEAWATLRKKYDVQLAPIAQ